MYYLDVYRWVTLDVGGFIRAQRIFIPLFPELAGNIQRLDDQSSKE